MRKRFSRASLLSIIGLAALNVVPVGANGDVLTLSSVTTISVPHAADSWAAGISDHGQIVGNSIAEGSLGLSGWSSDGDIGWFLSVPGASETVADDVNSRGDVVGAFVESGRTFGYLASSGGRFVRLEAPGWEVTYASGVNNRRQIVGHAINADQSSAFLFESGHYTMLDIPGAISYGANDINNSGQIVGGYFDEDGRLNGYLYDRGIVTSLLFPGSDYTTLVAINDRGQVIGNYGGPVGNGTFLYSNGVFAEIAPPDMALSFFISGINNSGRVVGQYSTLTDSYAFSADLSTIRTTKVLRGTPPRADRRD